MPASRDTRCVRTRRNDRRSCAQSPPADDDAGTALSGTSALLCAWGVSSWEQIHQETIGTRRLRLSAAKPNTAYLIFVRARDLSLSPERLYLLPTLGFAPLTQPSKDLALPLRARVV